MAPQHVPIRGHSWKLVKSHSSTDARRFFSVRVINRWNSLSQSSWCQLCECVQEPVGQDSEQQDVFLYGLVVRVTPWLYSARMVMSHSTRLRQQQQTINWLHEKAFSDWQRPSHWLKTGQQLIDMFYRCILRAWLVSQLEFGTRRPYLRINNKNKCWSHSSWYSRTRWATRWACARNSTTSTSIMARRTSATAIAWMGSY